jgi:hypothetical protein
LLFFYNSHYISLSPLPSLRFFSARAIRFRCFRRSGNVKRRRSLKPVRTVNGETRATWTLQQHGNDDDDGDDVDDEDEDDDDDDDGDVLRVATMTTAVVTAAAAAAAAAATTATATAAAVAAAAAAAVATAMATYVGDGGYNDVVGTTDA